jgi:propionyl-CoA synthetase
MRFAAAWPIPKVSGARPPNPPFYRWFSDGVLNTCFNALDRHVQGGRGSQPALIYDSPVTGTCRTFSYRKLLDQVARFGGVLRGLGVGAGDRVVIYTPMIPEALVAMLPCARVGAVHSVVFGGFAAHELAVRIDDAAPKVMVSASCGIEVSRTLEYKPILDRAIELAGHTPERCVVAQRAAALAVLSAGLDLDWEQAMAGAEPVACVPVAATDPLYILYTSGTTTKPKGVVRDNGGHAVALRWSMQHIYETRPGEVFWAASDVGGSSGIPTSSTPRCSPGARPCCMRESRWARRMQRVLASHRRAPRQDAVHRAGRVPGDQEGRPGRRANQQV